MRARGPVAQTGTPELTIPMHPFRRRLLADAEAGRGQLQRQALLQNPSGELLSTMNRKSGILMMVVHLVPPIKPIRRRTSFSQSERMDNLLKLHI